MFWDFHIQTDHLIQVRKPDLLVVNKKKAYSIVYFTVPVKRRKKVKREIYIATLVRKLVQREISVMPVVIGPLGQSPKNPRKKTWKSDELGPFRHRQY